MIRQNSLGTAYLGQARWADAEAAFRRADELRPRDPLLLNNIAVALLPLGRNDEAEALLARALELDPRFPPARYNSGLIAKGRGDFARAAEHFAAVAEIDPTDVPTWYNLAQALARAGRDQEARRAFEHALATDPKHVSTLYAFGQFLLRTGDAEEGRRLVAQSAAVRARSGIHEVVGSQYGEQGIYALGIDYPGDALAAPPPIAVRFTLAASARLAAGTDAVAWTLARRPDGGAPALVVADGTHLLLLPAAGAARPAGTVPGQRVLALAAADLDDDGTLDLAALSEIDGVPTLVVLRPSGGGGWVTSPDAPSGPAARGKVRALDADLVAFDRDHDGDIDLVWCWSADPTDDGPAIDCAVATNDGAGRLDARPGSEHGIAPQGRTPGPVSVALSDLDNDRDVDLLLLEPAGLHVFANLRDGTFEDVSAALGLGAAAGGGESMALADLDKNGWMDVVIAGSDGVRVLRNMRRRFEAGPTFPGGDAAAHAVVVLDHDNDGFLDLVAPGPGGRAGILRNQGAGRWTEEALGDDVPLGWIPLAACDADGDGDADLAARGADGRIGWLAGSGAEDHRWVTIDPAGAADNRFAIGTKVQVLAGALIQKFEVTRPLPLTVGLGERTKIDSVRLLWPGGVLQDEIGAEPDRTLAVQQLDRKGTSCPLLYAWNGAGWRFVTDFLGGAAVGYQLGPGIFNTPDPDEYVKIEGGIAEEPGGLVRLRVNNQLEEVLWFDALELVAVDHPAHTEVFPDERLMPGPPWPEFRIFAGSDVRPLAAARDVERGTDLADTLRRSDRRFAGGFELLRFKGYAKPHTLELDLGAFPAHERVVLLFDGWVDYADSSANLAAAQAGVTLVPPLLTVADGRGDWIGSGRSMGFPAGLPKTMAVELTGRFPSRDHRVRITTNMRIYWDRVRVLVGGSDTPLEIRRIPLESAVLRDGGFPRATSPDGRPPFGYDPQRVDPVAGWKVHTGTYTPFGDVRDALLAPDDRFVTTRSGDEIELRYRSPGTVRPGQVRTWLLRADGFGKDMDPNSAASDEVGPIPFHAMPSYPYPEDVIPPAAPSTATRGGRQVRLSGDGWHGAPPQTLALAPADLVLRGGTVVDGTGGPAVHADVAIRADRIEALGAPGTLLARRTLDVGGLVVAPGFVDLHSHADLILLGDRATQERLLGAKLRQGVTTVVVGNCGLGTAPTTPATAETVAAINAWMTPDGVHAGPLSTREYLARLERDGVALNVATLVPHGPLRIGAMGRLGGTPTAGEIATMREGLRDALDAGALGLSVGLIYPPGMYADTSELVELARVVAERDGLFTAHVRGSSETLDRATDELVEIARASGARVHHSHLEAVGRDAWPGIGRALEAEDRARAAGLHISHDVFPYTRAATMMSAIFPPWALEGGMPALLDRLRDPAARARIRHDIEHLAPAWPPWEPGAWPHNLVRAVGWDGIRVASVEPGGPAQFVGRSLAELGAAAGREPFDLVADLMLSQHGRVGQFVDEISGDEDDGAGLESILVHPAAAVVSDAEDYGRGAPHPAHAGAFARTLRLARERGLLTLEDAIHKMSGRPAALAGLADRGVLRAGAVADLVVFDPATVADRATWDDPRQPATGVRYVILGGTVVLDEGRLVASPRGRVLRRASTPLPKS